MIKTKPWTSEERKEIAQLRKAGKSDSYIYGFMKTGNKRRGNAPPLRSKKMATKKKGKTKKSTKKTTAGRKKSGKSGRKAGGFKIGDTLTAVQDQDDKFYKQFPRYTAYELLCKKKTMKTSAFVDAVEKLPNVNSRNQALGILTKLIEKKCAVASGEKKAA